MYLCMIIYRSRLCNEKKCVSIMTLYSSTKILENDLYKYLQARYLKFKSTLCALTLLNSQGLSTFPSVNYFCIFLFSYNT